MGLDRRRLRVLLIVTAGVAAAAIGVTLAATGAVDGAEVLTVDQRFQNRGTHDRPNNVVVVGIRAETPDAVGARPPFKRSIHAAAIQNLTRAGARVIVYDLQFSERTDPFDNSPAAKAAAEREDLALLDAMIASKRVVLGTDELTEAGPNVVFVDEDLAAADAEVGSALFGVGTGSVFRRLPYEVGGLRSLAVVAVDRLRDTPTPRAVFGSEGAWIDYHGPTGNDDAMPFVAFEDVISGAPSLSRVEDAIVVVGNTANNLGDVEPTPFGGIPMPGAEIHANAISTLLRGVPLRDAAGWLNVLILLGLVAVATAAALWRSAVLGIAAAAAVIALLVVLAQLAFNGGTVIDVVTPVIATGLVGIAGLAINYWLVVRDRGRLRTSFARFLPAQVVDDVIDEAGDNGRLGGRRVFATVLFADLRAFTRAAERMPPELVIDTLNRYLTEMSDAVLDNGGTLVAYQGDGLMAVFGAPVEQTDHADRALAAAREMRDRRLPAFNEWATRAGFSDGFRMGIGVASGPVMSGNVGSERRLEYAAVGDTTNAAARLENLTKETPHMLLIADMTRAALTRTVPDLTAVGALDVRGREVPASVWTLAEMPVGPTDAGPTMDGV